MYLILKFFNLYYIKGKYNEKKVVLAILIGLILIVEIFALLKFVIFKENIENTQTGEILEQEENKIKS